MSEPDSHSSPGSDHGGHGEGGHGEGGHGHHQEFNWFHGFLGAREGVEPSLLWRPEGTPPPFGATLLNTALLVALLVKLGGSKVSEGLKQRRQRLLKGMDEADAMRKEAEGQLQTYRDKLSNLDEEIERVRREMREASEAERKRVLSEAKARRARLEEEARVLIEQELKAVREELTLETSRAALRSAREMLTNVTTVEDQRRLTEEFVKGLDESAGRGNAGRSLS